MDVKIAPDWKELLAPEFEKPYFVALTDFVRQEYATRRIYPRGSNIFRAFDKCPFDRLKVVIIGQDPYHGPGQANGLCFSVADGIPFPPSLQNIFKEVSDDTGTPVPASGNLDRWAEQGVLLLNSVLTVRAHEAASHAGRGWETFTDAVVRAIAERKEGIVYMLWGSYAQRKGAIADPQRNLILKAVHPSPLSVYRGFFGCRHFSRANDYLRSAGKEPIVWKPAPRQAVPRRDAARRAVRFRKQRPGVSAPSDAPASALRDAGASHKDGIGPAAKIPESRYCPTCGNAVSLHRTKNTSETMTGIFYGSTTGSTEAVAQDIAKQLGIADADVHNVADASADETDKYDLLVLGSPTWGNGDLQDDWYGFLDRLKTRDLTGRKVALFGCGDSGSYPDTFCDAVGLLYEELQPTGCIFVGSYEPAGYDVTDSLVCADGRFVGLAIDESAPDKTEERVAAWCRLLRTEE